MTDIVERLARYTDPGDEVGAEIVGDDFGSAYYDIKDAKAEIERLRAQRDLLGQSLGECVVAAGIANDVPLTGPELLMLADDLKAFLAELRSGA